MIKVGIIGVGGIAQRHFDGYNNTDTEVIAIADINKDNLAKRQNAWGIPFAYEDYNELLARDDIQAVSICTPNAVHHPAVMAAAKAGKHILCEKPISLSLELAQEMIDASKKAGIIFQIGHHLRSVQAVIMAKKLIEDGVIGKINFARFRQAHDWAGAKTVSPAFGSIELAGGGTLLDNGCHMMDLSRYLVGQTKELYASMDSLKFDCEVEDTSLVTLHFENGAIGSVENAWTATGWEEAFWIYGNNGSLEYTNRYGPAKLRLSKRISPNTEWDKPDIIEYDLQGNQGHAAGVANFIEAIKGNRDVICTGEDGLEAVKLILRAYESAKQNRPVKV
ncbi:MAG TPA: Gfo/Idh/MocA family oxidoreductase [Trueperaceae bacterium]|nr:Gfo/Idh/MocA family oxidoreductase [Trueperaceae bacterium]